MKTTKEKIEVMQAYERGEQIEFCYNDENIKLWENTDGEPLWNWEDADYRVKPKTKYVQFDTAEEFLEAQRKHGITLFNTKEKVICYCFVNGYDLVCATNDDHTYKNYTLREIFENFYFFNDGKPCGKEVKA